MMKQPMNILAFTSLRGVACVIVVISHVLNILDLPHLLVIGSVQQALVDVFRATFNGFAAVEVFFVLSGCVLCLSLEHGAARGGGPWIERFYVRRLFRIYPALWLSVAVTLCLLPLIRTGLASDVVSDWARGSYPDQITAARVLLSMAAVYVHLNVPIWTLRVELFYSLAFPLFFLLIRNPRTRAPFIGCLILLAVLPIPRAWSLHYAMAFAFGTAIPYTAGIKRLPYRTIAVLAFAALMLVRSALEPLGLDWKTIEDVEILIAAVIIYCLYHNRAPFAALENRAVAFVGDISYSVYIVHFPLLFALTPLFIRFAGSDFIRSQPLTAVTLLGAATLAVTFVAATLARFYVERPGEQMGKALCNARYGARPSAAQLVKTGEEN